jgi:hypothetical protein
MAKWEVCGNDCQLAFEVIAAAADTVPSRAPYKSSVDIYIP